MHVLVGEGRVVAGRLRELCSLWHADVVLNGRVERSVASVAHIGPDATEEPVSASLWSPDRPRGDHRSLVPVDLRRIEDREPARHEASAGQLDVFAGRLVADSPDDGRPLDPGRALLSFAHLRTDRLPLLVGGPGAGRVAPLERAAGELPNVATVVGAAGHRVGRAERMGAAGVSPWPGPIPWAVGLHQRCELVRHALGEVDETSSVVS